MTWKHVKAGLEAAGGGVREKEVQDKPKGFNGLRLLLTSFTDVPNWWEYFIGYLLQICQKHKKVYNTKKIMQKFGVLKILVKNYCKKMGHDRIFPEISNYIFPALFPHFSEVFLIAKESILAAWKIILHCSSCFEVGRFASCLPTGPMIAPSTSRCCPDGHSMAQLSKSANLMWARHANFLHESNVAEAFSTFLKPFSQSRVT